MTLQTREREFLHLLNAVAVAANEARTVDEALQRVIDEVCAYTHWPVGHAYLPGLDGVLTPTGLWHLADPVRFASFRRATEQTRLEAGDGLLRGVVRSREPAWAADVSVDPDFIRAAAAWEVGLRAAFGLPVLLDGEAVAVLEFFCLEPLPPDESLLELGRHIGLQLGRAVERERMDEAGRQALHDSLTGLPNRTLFLDRLAQAVARSERSLDPVTVLVLDLDNFKRINDSLGHAAGDRLLTSVAERLGDTIRPPDTIARLGGDEFAVILEDTGIADGIRIAQRLGAALDRAFIVGGREVFARASVGVACGVGEAQTADDLLTNADLAMSLAKGEGKARYAVFESALHEAAIERLELEADLREAVVRGEFFLLYQPVVRLGDGSLVGMEALIRWKRGGGEVVPPDQFIPAAEETGTIREIGHWVLQEACRQVATWQAEHHLAPELQLSVNFSARQFEDPEIVKDVERVLVAAGLEPGCLVIELTESLLISEPDVAIRQLGDLRRLGVRLAIDDFGTGYSSLSYLRRFPVDVLKIDRSFVSVLGGGPEDAALAQAIVKLGRTLHLRVVAEGVETAGQLAELQGLDCEYGQGFLFGRPLTIEAMSGVLAAAGEGHRLGPLGGVGSGFPPLR